MKEGVTTRQRAHVCLPAGHEGQPSRGRDRQFATWKSHSWIGSEVAFQPAIRGEKETGIPTVTAGHRGCAEERRTGPVKSTTLP